MLPSLGALKGLGSGLYNMGRGALFMGASKGATTGGKIMNGIGHASPLAPVVAGSFKATSQQPGFQPQSTVKSSSHEPQEKWYERHGGPADLPTSPSERMALGSLGGLVGMALGGTVGGAYGAYKDHKAQNASGFQEQSANRTRSDSRSEPLHTEKLSVSREWINQRIQNAVNNGVDTSRLLAFSDRNDEAYNQLSSRDKPLVQAQRDRLSTAKGNRTTAANAAFAATQGPGVHDYFVPGYGGQAASSHSITVPAQTIPATVPAQTIPARAASVRTPKLLRNTALAAIAGLGAYGLYRALKKEEPTVKSSAELPPVVARALLAKVASDAGSTLKVSSEGEVSPGEPGPSMGRSALLGGVYGGLAGPMVSDLAGAIRRRSLNVPRGALAWELAGGAILGAAAGAASHAAGHPVPLPWPFDKGASIHPVVARALRAKTASDAGWHRPVNALSYAAFAAPYLSQTVHDNHKLTTALNAAGLLGLGATSADSLAKGDGLAGYDLAGLGLMGAGLVHGALRPSPTPGAGH